jgi:hypothetical protein
MVQTLARPFSTRMSISSREGMATWRIPKEGFAGSFQGRRRTRTQTYVMVYSIIKVETRAVSARVDMFSRSAESFDDLNLII